MQKEVADFFYRYFSDSPTLIVSSPGRVNLIGEHTDYNEGYVFPAAVSLRLTIASKVSSNHSSIVSQEFEEIINFDTRDEKPPKGWAKYLWACAQALQKEWNISIPNIEAIIFSEIPRGAGLSSSAALETASLFSWLKHICKEITLEELARIAWLAETKFVGVNCGMMDQLVCSLGRKRHAMLIDTRSLEFSYHSLPSDISIVIMDTRKPRQLAASAYNQRVAECKRAVEALRKENPEIRSLRDATLELLEAAKHHGLDEIAFKRARHVIQENDRVLAFAKALESKDFHALSHLAKESHISLKEDYEVSCPELDAMAQAAWEAPGCVAARLTGAGFGGSCVGLVFTDSLQKFERYVYERYTSYGFREPKIYSVEADDGVICEDCDKDK